MKKKSIPSPVGNTLVKEQESEERIVPSDAARILEEDSEARRIRLAEIKDLVASGRYDVSSKEVAKSIIQHSADIEHSVPPAGSAGSAHSAKAQKED